MVVAGLSESLWLKRQKRARVCVSSFLKHVFTIYKILNKSLTILSGAQLGGGLGARAPSCISHFGEGHFLYNMIFKINLSLTYDSPLVASGRVAVDREWRRPVWDQSRRMSCGSGRYRLLYDRAEDIASLHACTNGNDGCRRMESPPKPWIAGDCGLWSISALVADAVALCWLKIKISFKHKTKSYAKEI